jgi:hypothetical protein
MVRQQSGGIDARVTGDATRASRPAGLTAPAAADAHHPTAAGSVSTRRVGGTHRGCAVNVAEAAAKWLAGAWKTLLPVVVLGLLVFAVLLATGYVSLPSDRVHGASHQKPYEYLYLDSARVDAYLGQLTDGNVKSENRSESQATSGSVGLEVDKLGKATASTSSERKSSAVATLTEADNFYRLLRQLKSEGSLEPFDLEDPGLHEKLGKVQEGTMVLLSNVFIEVPPYLSAYPAFRYAAYRLTEGDEVFGAAPLTQFGPAEVALRTEVKRERAAFLKRVGDNPRLPLTVSPHGVTIMVPARFANITGDVSLFGARLTIVGKVVFKGSSFGDGASITTYLPALLAASTGFLHDLGVKHSFLVKYDHARRHHERKRVRTLQEKVFKALGQSLSFGDTVEVIPVAIYD